MSKRTVTVVQHGATVRTIVIKDKKPRRAR
jgi:hypothetical protein